MENIQKKGFSKFTLDAIKAAKLGGFILKKGFKTHFKIKKKSGTHNLVTEYDYKSEKAIISFIKKNYKDHKILSEEYGKIDSKSDYEWIIDPLDGTVNFAHQIPVFCVSIALSYKKEVISGAIYNPLLDELFSAEKSKGSYCNGKRMRVTKTKNLNEAFLSSGFPYTLKKNPDRTIERFTNILNLGLPIRRLGSAALDIAYVADGRFDIFWETNLRAWDVAAALLMLKEADGEVSNYDGSNFEMKDKNALVASNKLLHKQFLKEFNKL